MKKWFCKKADTDGSCEYMLHARHVLFHDETIFSFKHDVLKSALKSSQASSSTNVFSKPTTSLSASISHRKMGS
jgi:hypothetical protein